MTLAGPTVPSRTGMLQFTASAPFSFHQHNTAKQAEQSGVAGERYYTSSQQLANNALTRDPRRFRILDAKARIACLPRDAWATTDYAGKRVLFILPSQALGDNVSTLLFLHAFAEHAQPKSVGAFGTRSASDIYFATQVVRAYPLWIGERELKNWDIVVDLGHLETRRDIEVWPLDMESELLAAFRLPPAARFPAEARPLAPRGNARIGILPLASSPLRTLPPQATLALAEAMAPFGQIAVSLNREQKQGQLYAAAVAERLPPGTEIIDGFPTIGGLLASVAAYDYGVFADSGPAHMSKLFAIPGVAVYSSAPGDVLQGRFTNLRRWTIPFVGPYCASPCGLAKLRQTEDGRIGCMGSLGVSLAELPHPPKGGDAAVVERLFAAPVPCVAALAAAPRDLVDFVVADLKARLAAV
jgi:hypothetical protein